MITPRIGEQYMNRESMGATLSGPASERHDPASALRIAIFSCGSPTSPVGFLRLAGPVRRLERQKRVESQWYDSNNSQIDIEALLDCDVFVFQREFCGRDICSPVIAAAREMGKPMVFELDDLLTNLPRKHPDFKRFNEMTPDILAMLRDADFVTVTTEPLRRYLEDGEPQAKGKIHVLPNFVDLDIWGGGHPPGKREEPFVVGWFGTATHDEDLAIVKPAIVRLAQKYAGSLVFKFWGYLPEELRDIPGVILVRGPQGDLERHARDVAGSRIDLALGPLVDHPFNHAKSDLKWLEYSACYIPGIYSTISPYTASVEHGRTGWLVENRPELWIEAIERFMRDDEIRRSVAMQAHDEVVQKRNAQAGAEQWEALYRSFRLSPLAPGHREATAVSAARDRAAAHLKRYAADAARRRGSWATRKFRKITRWTRKVRSRFFQPALTR
jgi:glycosyltransferase involved in cell wall biosynthesis